MKRQKKQYRPIDGQTRVEKVLDWVTRDEFADLLMKYHFCFLAYMMIWCFVAHTLLDGSEDALILVLPFLGTYIFWIPAGVVHVVGSFWGFRMERKLQKPMKDYIEISGQCTYNELVTQCMPLKIHVGIDDALEKMLRCHELVLEDGYYRLPTDEDRKKWREEDLKKFGVKISFEDLEKIFALDLKELEESIDIEFSLGEHDGYWMGKTEDDVSGGDIFWLMVGTGERIDFTTFQEMSEASLFDGQSLRTVWGDAVLTFINDQDMAFWLDQYLP